MTKASPDVISRAGKLRDIITEYNYQYYVLDDPRVPDWPCAKRMWGMSGVSSIKGILECGSKWQSPIDLIGLAQEHAELPYEDIKIP